MNDNSTLTTTRFHVALHFHPSTRARPSWICQCDGEWSSCFGLCQHLLDRHLLTKISGQCRALREVCRRAFPQRLSNDNSCRVVALGDEPPEPCDLGSAIRDNDDPNVLEDSHDTGAPLLYCFFRRFSASPILPCGELSRLPIDQAINFSPIWIVVLGISRGLCARWRRLLRLSCSGLLVGKLDKLHSLLIAPPHTRGEHGFVAAAGLENERPDRRSRLGIRQRAYG